MMKKILLTGTLLVSFGILCAQPKILTGLVVDSGSNPAAGVTITLLLAKDSSVQKRTLTNPSGKYLIALAGNGKFLVTAEAAGWMKMFLVPIESVDGSDTLNLPVIKMRPLIKELAAVTVRSVKPFIETKVDRTVINVDALIANTGVSAWEVLQNAPGVQAQDNGALSMAGKAGVMVFIDDRPTYLSGSDLANYLRSLPSDAVEKLELMTNPPARYDAAGNAGIINIRLKKAKARGFNASVNLGYNQAVYGSPNANIQFNVRQNKFAISGFSAYNTGSSFVSASNNRQYLGSTGSLFSVFDQRIYVKNTKQGFSNKVGIDYYLNQKTTLGIVAFFFLRPSVNRYFSNAEMSRQSGGIDSTASALNTTDEHFTSKSINLNLRHNIDSAGSRISVDADAAFYDRGKIQSNTSKVIIPSAATPRTDASGGDVFSGITIYSLKSDYTRVFRHGSTFNAGAKLSYTTTDNPASYYNVTGSGRIPNNALSNHFRYTETITAIYTNLQKEWSRFALQLGIRLESTTSSGRQTGNTAGGDSSFRRSYTNLFPTLFFQYKLDGSLRNQLFLSYGRRISRPSFNDLNPFVSPVDLFTVFTGNPYLRPVFSDNVELKHVFKDFLTTSAAVSFTRDQIAETVEMVGTKEYDRPGNIGNSRMIRFAVTANLKPVPWWTVSSTADYQFRHYNTLLYGQTFDTTGRSFSFSAVSQLSFKDWTFEQSGSWQSASFEGQLTTIPEYSLNLGVRKKLWNNRASLRINIRDLFYSNVNAGQTKGLMNVISNFHEKFDSRSVGISLSISLGKQIKEQRRHDESSAEDEKGRAN